MEKLLHINPILLALIATLFTYFMNLLGSCTVLLFKEVSKNVLDCFLAFGAGIMIASSFFSLLNPAIDKANQLNMISWLVISIGFLFGGLFIILSDIFLTKLLANKYIKTSNRSILMFSAITLHNVPEGMAIGVAFASLFNNPDMSILISSIMLAFGIGIQNFPEGVATSLPLRREGVSKGKALFIGQASGLVEPFAGVLGCVFTLYVNSILPLLLSFSAGAMIATCVSELIPEASKSHKTESTLWFTLGFIVMMILDVALG